MTKRPRKRLILSQLFHFLLPTHLHLKKRILNSHGYLITCCCEVGVLDVKATADYLIAHDTIVHYPSILAEAYPDQYKKLELDDDSPLNSRFYGIYSVQKQIFDDDPDYVYRLLAAPDAQLPLSGWYMVDCALFGAMQCVRVLMLNGTEPIHEAEIAAVTGGNEEIIVQMGIKQPYAYAIHGFNEDVERWALDTMEITDAERESALKYAFTQNNFKKVLELYRDHIPARTAEYVADSLNYDMMYFMLEHGQDPNERCRFGKSLLQYAQEIWNHDIVELLLQFGADPNICDETGQPILARAIGQGDVKSAKLLLQWGADPHYKGAWFNIIDTGGRREKMLQLLLQFHTDINAPYTGDHGLVWHLTNEKDKSEYADEIALLVKYGARQT